jgi:hypothetical protein
LKKLFKILKLSSLLCILLTPMVIKAEEFATVCNSCSNTVVLDRAEDFATSTAKNYVNIFDSDNGNVRRFVVRQLPSWEDEGDFSFEKRSRRVEIFVAELTPSQDLKEAAVEIKSLASELQKYSIAASGKEKDLLEGIADKFGISVGHFQYIELSNSSFSGFNIRNTSVGSVNAITVAEYLHAQLGIRVANPIARFFAQNVATYVIVKYPNGTYGVYKSNYPSSIPYEPTGITFDENGKVISSGTGNYRNFGASLNSGSFGGFYGGTSSSGGTFGGGTVIIKDIATKAQE